MKKVVLILMLLFSLNALGKTYNIAWSIYVGWMPWQYAEYSKILDKWAKKYEVDIKLTKVNDYVESISAYTAGKFDGCTMTNMDALTIPAVGGVDSSALIIGDYSNGNDGIISRKLNSIKDLKGEKVMLVQLSVSHYLLTRALSMNQMSEKDLTLVNTSDADIGGIFSTDVNANVVTWNPILMKIRQLKGANVLFDSSKIPGEIIDMLVVRTDVSDSLKKALVGAWFETMSIMKEGDKSRDKALSYMANQAGSSQQEFEDQLKATAMFYSPSEAVHFAEGNTIKNTMNYVRSFSFKKGLFGQGANSEDFVGIQFPDGTVIGDSKNVKLRFDSKFMKMASENKI